MSDCIKIPAKRFICSEDGELDHIKLRLDGELLENIDDPKFSEYNNKFTPVTFVNYKMTIKDGFLHIEDPSLGHMDSLSDSAIQKWEERVKFITSIDNWKNKILCELDLHNPRTKGIFGIRCCSRERLIIDQPDHILPNQIKERVDKFESDEY